MAVLGDAPSPRSTPPDAARLSYDAAGRATQVAHLDSSNAVFSSFEYGYDNTTNRTSILEHAGDRGACGYDPTTS